MKNIKKSALIMSIMILSLSFLPMKTYARPFIGSETVTETSVNESGCEITISYKKNYFLWFYTGASEFTMIVRC
ncbi:MAG: hypothetical protein ACK5KP_12930 [Paludibacteraceae bacterium]